MVKYLVANWKMNPDSLSKAKDLLHSYKNFGSRGKTKLVVCPPAVFLPDLAKQFGTQFVWGAQNCFWQSSGPFTGELSPAMLKFCGVKYVIVGHSERREHLAESDEMINKKIKAIHRENLTPILCVGGGKEAKKRNADIKKIIQEQLIKGLENFSSHGSAKLSIIIAYEPAWAISSGDPYKTKFVETPSHAGEMATFIRKILKGLLGGKPAISVPIIYGGSTDAANMGSFLKEKSLNGFLVGGASLDKKEFSKMQKLMN